MCRLGNQSGRLTTTHHEGCHLVSITVVDGVSGGSTRGLDVGADRGYGVWVIMISADPFGVRTPPGLAVPTLGEVRPYQQRLHVFYYWNLVGTRLLLQRPTSRPFARLPG